MLVRHSPRRLVVWIVGGLVALALARVVSGDLAAVHGRARSAGPAVATLVAARDLPLGHTIGDGDVEVVQRHERHRPDDPLTSADVAAGRIVAVPLLAGAVVTARHLAPSERTGLDGIVPAGMRVVKVPIEDAPDLRPGAVVDVLVTFDPALTPPGLEATTTVVEGAVVVSGADVASDAAVEGVTLLVDEPASRRLAFAVANGIVTLALAPPEEACCPKSSSTPSSASSKG